MTLDRFVILHHLAPAGEHWDLMLELGDVLVTWQLLSEFCGSESCPIQAVRINDHRKHYLDYEGPIGGGRGVVSRCDRGRYERFRSDESEWIVGLRGERVGGQFRLLRQPDSPRWVLDRV